jgi:hypothetical protein
MNKYSAGLIGLDWVPQESHKPKPKDPELDKEALTNAELKRQRKDAKRLKTWK